MRKVLVPLAGIGLLLIGFGLGVGFGLRLAESLVRDALSSLAGKLPDASGQPTLEDWFYPDSKKDAGGRILEGTVSYPGLATFRTTSGQYQLLTTPDSYDKVVAYYQKHIKGIVAQRLGTAMPAVEGTAELPSGSDVGSGCSGGSNNDVFAGQLHLYDALQPHDPVASQRRPRGVRTALLGYRGSGYIVNVVVSRTVEEKDTHVLLTFDSLSIVPEAAK